MGSAASSTRQPQTQAVVAASAVPTTDNTHSLTDVEDGASVELSLFYENARSLSKARALLERLLDSGGTELLHFQHWLVERHAEELLHFLIAARDITAREFSEHSEFLSLYDEFIVAGASQELNISSSARRRAAEAFSRNPGDWNTVPGVASAHLSPVVLEVTDLLIKTHWFAFVKHRTLQISAVDQGGAM